MSFSASRGYLCVDTEHQKGMDLAIHKCSEHQIMSRNVFPEWIWVRELVFGLLVHCVDHSGVLIHYDYH